jgi:hypothetical protein
MIIYNFSNVYNIIIYSNSYKNIFNLYKMKNIIMNKNFNKEIKKYVKKQQVKGLCDVDIKKKNRCRNSSVASQFKDLENLGNKNLQYSNTVKYLKERPYYLPETIPFKKHNMEKLKKIFNSDTKKWIVKPENSLNRNGIGVFESYNKLVKFVKQYNYNEWIIQEFIDNPLLIDGKKFHFRVYVLIIKDNKMFKTLMYNRGFLYFSTKKYNSNNEEAYLTDGKTKSQVKVFPQFYNKHYDNFDETIVPQLKIIVNDTIESVYKNLECVNNSKCYKYLGYDILIDKFYRCYLAEINTNLIGFPHTPFNFKNRFYSSILDVVLKNKNENFVFINRFEHKSKKLKIINETITETSPTGFTSLNKYLIIFILIVIIICFVCLLNYFNFK